MKLTHLAANWGLEYWFYKIATQALLTSEIEKILQTPSTSYFSFLTIPPSIITPLIMYIIGARITTFAHDRYLIGEEKYKFDIKATFKGIKVENPIPVASIISAFIPKSAALCATPQGLGNISHSIFKGLNLLPAWTESFWYMLTEDIVALYIFLVYYKKVVIKPLIAKFIEKNQAAIEQLKTKQSELIKNNQQQQASEQEETFVQLARQSIQTSFLPWMINKTTSLNVCKTVTRVVLATPELFAKGKQFYNAYQQVNNKNKNLRQG
ncbi:MAG: hypothetical protein M0Q46_06530 [Endomicrobiales bacterium]|nr:hypothetical protein [Endomicrobiales bacterium]